MNILVIGNGFDLAHGLPTTYMDFFNFIVEIRNRLGYSDKIIGCDNLTKYVSEPNKKNFFEQLH